MLDYLAVEEPLSLADLTTLAGDGAVQQAQDWGAAETRVRDARGDDPVVYTAHPLFAERARAALGDDAARRRRTDLVDAARRSIRRTTSATGCGWRRWRVDSDAPQPVDEVVEAAAAGAAAGRPRARPNGWPARRWTRSGGPGGAAGAGATRWRWQGRGREADAVLAAVDPAALSEPELMAWALPRAANQFWMLSEPERATAFLQTIRNRVTDAGRARHPRRAERHLRDERRQRRARRRIAGEVLSSPSADDQAVAWAASAAALCSARQGRFDDVEPMAQRALAAEHPGLLRFTIGLGQITALLMAGRLTRRGELAQQFTDFAELQQPGRAIGEVLLAHVLIAQGEFDRAAALLEPAAATLARTGYSWGPLSLMLLATALAQQGDIAGVGKSVEQGRIPARHQVGAVRPGARCGAGMAAGH